MAPGPGKPHRFPLERVGPQEGFCTHWQVQPAGPQAGSALLPAPGALAAQGGGHVRLWLGNRALGGLPKRIQSLRAEVGEAYSLGLGLGFHDLETHSESPVGFPQG